MDLITGRLRLSEVASNGIRRPIGSERIGQPTTPGCGPQCGRLLWGPRDVEHRPERVAKYHRVSSLGMPDRGQVSEDRRLQTESCRQVVRHLGATLPPTILSQTRALREVSHIQGEAPIQ